MPTWLWPEVTMHLPTGRRNVRQPGPGLPAQFLSKVMSLLCPPNGTRGAEGPLAIVAGDNPSAGCQGFLYGRASRPGLDCPFF